MTVGFINGKFISVEELVLPIDERGHNFGDGVYEVIRVYRGKPFLLDEHLERLANSAREIRLDLPYSLEGIKGFIHEGIERSGLKEVQVYLQVTRGIATRQHLFPHVPPSITMTFRPASSVPDEYREKGVTAISLPDERWANCYIKSLNLLPNILAKQKAHDAGSFEAILVRDGYVTEGSSTNVFMVKNGVVVTPPLTKHILPGITRMALLGLMDSLATPYEERQFTLEELKQADEVFITSTTIEIVPVVKLDDSSIGTGVPGPITKRLAEEFKSLYAVSS